MVIHLMIENKKDNIWSELGVTPIEDKNDRELSKIV